MSTSSHRNQFIVSGFLVLFSFLLILVVVPALPATAAISPAPSASNDACAHILKAASNGSGPEVECFLNATGIITFDPAVLTVPANASIIFNVGNIGGLNHTFTLDNVSNDSTLSGWMAAPSSVTGTTLNTYFAKHTAENLIINGTTTDIVSKTPVTLPSAHGTFGFVCLFPGHFQQGMFGELYEGVQAAAPTVTPTITLPVQTGILVVAFLILAVASVLILYAQFGARAMPVRARGPNPADPVEPDP